MDSDTRLSSLPVPPAQDTTPDLRGVLLFLRRRRALILSCALLGALAGTVAGYDRKPVYRASALVLLQPGAESLAALRAAVPTAAPDSAFVETQVRLAKTPSFLEAVVDRLDLVPSDSAELAELAEKAADRGERRTDFLARWIPLDWLLATGVARERPRANPQAFAEALKKDWIARLASGIEARQEGRSFILSVGFTAPDPGLAARVANTAAELFVERQTDRETATLQATQRWLQSRIEELGAQLRSTEREIAEKRVASEVMQGGALAPESEQASALTNLLVEARAQRREKEARLRYIETLAKRGDSLTALSEVLESPYMQALWEQENRLAMQEADLLSTYGARHPTIMRLRSEQERLRQQQEQEIARIIDNIRNEVSVLRERERSIQSDIDQLLASSGEAARRHIEIRELEREAEATRRIYETLLQRQKEVEAQLQAIAPRAQVVARAEPPEAPAGPPAPLFGVVGLLGGSLIGLGLAWVRERLDTALRSPREVELLFGLPCLALVPKLPSAILRKYPHLAHYVVAKPLSAYAEGIRSLYTGIETSDLDAPPKVVQVTSAVPEEGKTSTATSLAALLAGEGHNVLLVDLDLRRPKILREICRGTTPSTPALLDCLSGTVRFEDAIVHDDRTGVDVLPARRPPKNPAAVLGSQKLHDLVERCRKAYDYVIIDSAPVLGMTDALRVSRLVDATVFVIKWGDTDADTAEEALAELKKAGARLAGVCLTMTDLKAMSYYGYGLSGKYYHKYRKYYAD